MSTDVRTIDLGGTHARPALRRTTSTAVASLAVLLATLALVPAYGPRAVLPTLGAGILLGAVIVLVGRARRAGGIIVLAATAVAYLVFGGAFAAPSTTVARVVPTLDTLLTLLEGLVTSWKEVLTLEPPLGTLGAVLVPPFVMALGGTVLAAWAATVDVTAETRRSRTDGSAGARRRERVGLAVALATPMLLLVGAILLGTVEAPLATFVGMGIVALMLPWLAWRTRRWHPRRYVTLTVMAVVALGGGYAGAPYVAGDAPRTVLRNTVVPPFDLRDQVSPLSGFRSFHKELRETPLVTVAGLPEGALVRLATMDAFDGVVWNVDPTGTLGGSGAFRRVGESIPVRTQGTEASIDVKVEALRGVWMPTVGQTSSLTFEGRRSRDQQLAFRFNDATGAAVLPGGLRQDDRWSAEVVIPPGLSDEQLADAAVADVRQPEIEHIPDAATQKAADIARNATSPALLARALEATLSEQGYFSHGITAAGDHPSLVGHGVARVDRLLSEDRMIGDDEQYASAMALMARNLGLPARVVMGFRPAEGVDTSTPVTFTGADTIAWVEIAYAGHGWVPYFPTPDTSRTPSSDPEQAEPDPQPEVVQPPPSLEDPVAVPDDEVENVDVEAREDVEVITTDWTRVIVTTVAVAVPLLLILLPPLLIVSAKTRRRRRRRKARAPMARVTGAWDEVLDAVRDRAEPPATGATRTEASRAIEAAFPGVSARNVALHADAAVFGPGDPDAAVATETWKQTDLFLAALAKNGTRRSRLRGQFSARSLRAARARRREAKAVRRRQRALARRGRAATKVRRAARR
ncbi:transglutaminase-like domain-containing protein [Sanguibacter sp. HDW7]|uniref:transglutaminase-like domain-containing protein n=1 Tax=Sanguibacter sp. HDW7 TaxID=2714931 RepID=UPI00140CB506|nr:transglutaminase-like domain-containing protein [Sanguibacter sp. HDW7]QIK82621.1 transglutaminase domain-containing protein [Sanguibacter sp. HDW7]